MRPPPYPYPHPEGCSGPRSRGSAKESAINCAGCLPCARKRARDPIGIRSGVCVSARISIFTPGICAVRTRFFAPALCGLCACIGTSICAITCGIRALAILETPYTRRKRPSRRSALDHSGAAHRRLRQPTQTPGVARAIARYRRRPGEALVACPGACVRQRSFCVGGACEAGGSGGDRQLGAMLLERCEPGTGLWMQPKTEQDLVLAGVLKRLRRMPTYSSVPASVRDGGRLERGNSGRFRTMARRGTGPRGTPPAGGDAGTATGEALLATDLHAGNVLRAQREPWLAIDPKPYVGDPAYDATQHLLNRVKPGSDPLVTIRRFAEIADLDPERVRLWTFARAAAQPRDDWSDDSLMELARAIAP